MQFACMSCSGFSISATLESAVQKTLALGKLLPYSYFTIEIPVGSDITETSEGWLLPDGSTNLKRFQLADLKSKTYTEY